MKKFGAWLALHWVAGALFMALALLALAPLCFGQWTRDFSLLYLSLPAYMLHQVEEHTGDRFRRFVNEHMFGGLEALTTPAVLWANLVGVWAVILLALYAAYVFDPGWGLAAAYMLVVNGLVHVAGAVRARGYNPGLWTGAFLFLPLGVATLALVPADWDQELFGLALSLAVHAAIIVDVVRRAHRLSAVEATAH